MADVELPTPPASTPFFGAWRPLIGWISVIGFALKFVALPLLGIALTLCGHPVASLPPDVDITALITLCGTAIGFGGMRSLEKLRGVAR